MRTPLESPLIFKERRRRLADLIPGAAVILASPLEYIRNGSVQHSFRQDSNLYYLTGFEEPGSIFVFRPGQTPESILFVRTKNPEREVWDGFRYGPEAAQSLFQVDKTYPIEDFDKEIIGLLKGVDRLFYRLYKNHEMDDRIETALQTLRMSRGRSGHGLLPILDVEELLGELRVIKEGADLNNIRMACEISAEAHIDLMKYVRPGMNERELHGYFVYQLMKRGAAREGYGGIFAGGANACTLHYVFNDQEVNKDDLLLVDAAGEYNYFTGDITRTYPISGKFNKAQEEVYLGVLGVQKTIIEMVKPGVTWHDLQEAGNDLLTDLMLSLGLLSGRKEDILKSNQHKKYYPHGIGHFLGMDVHDVGIYMSKQEESRKLEQGMVFTVEPGLYIPADDTGAAAPYRGIGVRVEDNILVTENGFEVLTKRCPKEMEDLSKIIGTA